MIKISFKMTQNKSKIKSWYPFFYLNIILVWIFTFYLKAYFLYLIQTYSNIWGDSKLRQKNDLNS